MEESLFPTREDIWAPSFDLKTDMVGAVCSVREVTRRPQTQWLNDELMNVSVMIRRVLHNVVLPIWMKAPIL